MNDNFRELLGVVAALVLYLGMLWFVLLNPNSAVEIFTEAKVARSVEHQMATEG